MGFWNKLLKRSPEKIKKEREKIELLVEIKRLIGICDNLIDKCNKRLTNTIDENEKLRLKFIIDKLKQTLHHLQDSYSYLDAINIKFTIEELKQAEKEIYAEGIDDHLNFFIRVDSKMKVKSLTNGYTFHKNDKINLQNTRTNILRLIKTLPEYKLE